MNIANTAFINRTFTCDTITDMEKQMHKSVVRLLAAATKRDRNVTRLADLARALNSSEQVLNNWAYRGHGVSKEGRLLAQKVFGINATWIEDGHGPEFTVEEKGSTPDVPTREVVSPLSPAAKALTDAIRDADRHGLSAEAFDVLRQTLKHFVKLANVPDGTFRIDDPIR